MRTFFTTLILSISFFYVWGQNTLLNENVIILGVKKFDNPISIELRKDARTTDSCGTCCANYNEPNLLLMEKTYLDTIEDYTKLSVFNQNCYEYTWFFFPRLVQDYILPYMDKTTELYEKVKESYPNLIVHPFEHPVRDKIDKDLFYCREVVPHDFLIVLMNAKTYNEYRLDISPPISFFKGTFEENGIYFKVAIPLSE